MPEKIELAKTRDLGEIINDTFTFIKQNFRPLLKYLFIFCGFFVLATLITSIITQIKMVDNISADLSDFNTSPFKFFGIEYFLTMFFALLTFIAITVTMISYLAIYKEKGNMPPETEEMWSYFKYYFLRVFGSSLLLAVLIGFASLFCLIPGIYLYPIFALIYPIMIIENTTFGYAFNRSFQLIKHNWWVTFGTIVITIIILYVAAMVVAIPSAIFGLSGIFLHVSSGKPISIITIIVTNLVSHIIYLLYMLPIVTSAFCYFNLTEAKEGTGLMDRINKLGDIAPDNDHPAEEY